MQITNAQAAGKRIARIELRPAALQVTTVNAGATQVVRLPINGAGSNVHQRTAALVRSLRDHLLIPAALAHQPSSTLVPTGLLEI